MNDERPELTATHDPFHHFAIFGFVACLLIFLCIRLYRLTALPIFNDEAFYIHWAAIIHGDISSLWLPLVDGKTPLFYWINALTYGIFSDPLVSGRIVSVASGFVSVCIFYAIGRAVGRPQAGLVAALLYTFMPYAIINDRLATVDSFHTTFVLASLYMSMLICRPSTGRNARPPELLTGGRAFLPVIWPIVLGLALAAAFLAKTPTLLFVPIPALMILIERKDRFSRRILAGLALAYLMLAAVIVLYLTRDVAMIGSSGSKILHRSRFFIPMGQLLAFPIEKWASNLRDLGGYLWAYFTPPLILASVAAIAGALAGRRWKTILVALWTLIPMVAMLLLTKETFSRYYLVVITPMLWVVASELDNLIEWTKGRAVLEKQLVRTACVFALVTYLAFSSLFIFTLKNPAKTPWVARDRWQYLEGYPSGYGLDKIISYLKDRAAKTQIVVFTGMSWGNPEDAVWDYLDSSPNALVVECPWMNAMPIIPPAMDKLPVIKSKWQQVAQKAILTKDINEAYFVARSSLIPRREFEILNRRPELIMDVPKPDGKDGTLLYKLTKPEI